MVRLNQLQGTVGTKEEEKEGNGGKGRGKKLENAVSPIITSNSGEWWSEPRLFLLNV